MATMRAFASAGIDYISHSGLGSSGNRLTEYLVGQMPEEKNAINYRLPNSGPHSSDVFWPLPDISGNNDIIAFFRPRISGNGKDRVMTMQLILTHEKSLESIGLRFEQGALMGGKPKDKADRHFYLHVQMTPTFNSSDGGLLTFCLPPSFTSCPASPLPPIGPCGTWFASLIAVAGHQLDKANGVVRVFDGLGDVFKGDFERAKQDLETTIKKMLGSV